MFKIHYTMTFMIYSLVQTSRGNTCSSVLQPLCAPDRFWCFATVVQTRESIDALNLTTIY